MTSSGKIIGGGIIVFFGLLLLGYSLLLYPAYTATLEANEETNRQLDEVEQAGAGGSRIERDNSPVQFLWIMMLMFGTTGVIMLATGMILIVVGSREPRIGPTNVNLTEHSLDFATPSNNEEQQE